MIMAGEIRISCDDKLDRIVDALDRLSPVPVLIDKEYYGWQLKQINGKKTFNQVVTFAGSTMSIELPISGSISLKRIEQWYSSSDVKTFNVRMHSQINPDAYAELDSVSANADISHIIDMGEGYVYLTPTKLVFNFSSYTIGDKVNLQVQLEEL